MKLLLTLLSLVVATPAFAVAPTATAVHLQLHSTSTIPYNSWTEVVAATGGVVKEISVYNNTTNPIEIGVGASGSEVVHLIAPSGVFSASDWATAPPSASVAKLNYFPVKIAANRRVAVRCKRSTCVVGDLQMNFLYN